MNKLRKIWNNVRLSLLFAVTVFVIMLASMLVIFAVMFLLYRFGIFRDFGENRVPLFLFAMISLVVGTVFAAIFSHRPLRPIREIMETVDQVADGDYSVRLHLTGPPEFQELSERFNHMAEELGSVEMLRTDFVNNFSHEFKTPVVSIRGFARMLKLDDLTVEERNEYLDIIIEESERLTELSTNVLNLSKIEQQSILTEKKRFNVSEQIRRVIAVMYSKWEKKQMEIVFDCGEIFLTGNEELLRQVWINLLDNAVKFSPDGGTVTIDARREGGSVRIAVSNEGEPISEEQAEHIFDKFYQADTSHAVTGNGLGLAIVKKIVELHGGRIYLQKTQERKITFVVEL